MYSLLGPKIDARSRRSIARAEGHRMMTPVILTRRKRGTLINWFKSLVHRRKVSNGPSVMSNHLSPNYAFASKVSSTPLDDLLKTTPTPGPASGSSRPGVDMSTADKLAAMMNAPTAYADFVAFPSAGTDVAASYTSTPLPYSRNDVHRSGIESIDFGVADQHRNVHHGEQVDLPTSNEIRRHDDLPKPLVPAYAVSTH